MVFLEKVGKNIKKRKISKEVIRQILRSEQIPLSTHLLIRFIVLRSPIARISIILAVLLYFCEEFIT
jgi:hypothetical protein